MVCVGGDVVGRHEIKLWVHHDPCFRFWTTTGTRPCDPCTGIPGTVGRVSRHAVVPFWCVMSSRMHQDRYGLRREDYQFGPRRCLPRVTAGGPNAN